jgi:mono/diheme cytochrome c family protein
MPSHVARARITRILLVAAMVIALWQVSIALAQAPQPNALAPVPGGAGSGSAPSVDLSANGPAAAIHGDPGAGRLVFARKCASCHGDRGTAGMVNPGNGKSTLESV